MSDDIEKLMLRYLDGSPSQADCNELNRRLTSDPVAARLFLDLAGDELAMKDALASTAAMASTTNAGPESLPEHPALRLDPPARSPRRIGLWLSGLAAAVLVGVGIWLTADSGSTSNPQQAYTKPTPPAVFSLAVAGTGLRVERQGQPVSADLSATLVGGDVIRTGDSQGITLGVPGETTTVVISPGTSISLEPSKSGHGIRLLAGSVQCEVAPQKTGRSFVVLTSDAEVRVIGTGFKVASDGRGSSVEVDHGTVRVTRNRDRATVDVSGGEFVSVGKTPARQAGKDMGEYWSTKVRPAGIDQ